MNSNITKLVRGVFCLEQWEVSYFANFISCEKFSFTNFLLEEKANIDLKIPALFYLEKINSDQKRQTVVIIL